MTSRTRWRWYTHETQSGITHILPQDSSPHVCIQNLGSTPWCECAPELSVEDGYVTLIHRAAIQRLNVPDTCPWGPKETHG